MKHLRANRFAKLAIAILAVGSLSGCSVKGSIEDLAELFDSIGKSGNMTTGLAAGAQHNVQVGDYKVSHSVGSAMDGVSQTSNGYTVYSTVQGNLMITPE